MPLLRKPKSQEKGSKSKLESKAKSASTSPALPAQALDPMAASAPTSRARSEQGSSPPPPPSGHQHSHSNSKVITAARAAPILSPNAVSSVLSPPAPVPSTPAHGHGSVTPHHHSRSASPPHPHRAGSVSPTTSPPSPTLAGHKELPLHLDLTGLNLSPVHRSEAMQSTLSGGSTVPLIHRTDFYPTRPPLSADDASSIFERDVEFPSDHLLSAHEAVDVAIPPVLLEAAELLTSEEAPKDIDELVDLVREQGTGRDGPLGEMGSSLIFGAGSGHVSPTGWSSPSRQSYYYSSNPMAQVGSGSASGAGSPTGAYSPPTFAGSPSSSSPPPLSTTYPTSPASGSSLQTPPLPASGSPPLFFAHQDKMEELAITADSVGLSNEGKDKSPRPRSLSPNLVGAPLTTTGLPPSPTSNIALNDEMFARRVHQRGSTVTTTGDKKRLSFMSYADILNEERIAAAGGWERDGYGGIGGQGETGAEGMEQMLDTLEQKSGTIKGVPPALQQTYSQSSAS